MKEYEFIYTGIENLLIDDLICAICQESLENRTIEGAFHQLFDFYKDLRETYIKQQHVFENPDLCKEALEKFKNDCIAKRNNILESFLVDIRKNYPILDIDTIVRDYYNKIDEEDILTTDKRVCIYPYIMSKIRHHKEEVISNGN